MDLSAIKIGFIGAGNMAQALGKGMITSGNFLDLCNAFYSYVIQSLYIFKGLVKADQLWASAPDDGTLDAWKTWGSHVISDNSKYFIYKIRVLHLNYSKILCRCCV